MPSEEYLIKRLNLEHHHPTRRRTALLSTANIIEKQAAECEKKIVVAGEAAAVAEAEDARLTQLMADLYEKQQKYLEVKEKYDRHPMGREGMPKELVVMHDSALNAVQVSESVCETQRRIATREEKLSVLAQHEASKSEANVAKVADVMVDLRKLLAAENEKKRKSAKKSSMSEVKQAKLLETRQRTKAAEFQVKLTNAEEHAAKQVTVARESHKQVANRVKETTRVAEDSKQYMEEARLINHENRVAATLELKANTDASTAGMRGANEKAKIKEHKKRVSEKKEFDEILKMGGNPYVVFKKREMEKKGKQEEKREKEKVRLQQASLASKMVKEDDYNRKKEEHERMEKEYESSYRNEQGKEVIEKRNRDYLISKTTNKTDLIDPTGKIFKIEPSQVTTVQDASFGLGYNPRKDRNQLQDVIDMVSKKYPDSGLGEFARLVPKEVKVAESLDDEDKGGGGLDGLVSPKAIPPGRDVGGMNRTGLEDEDADEDEVDDFVSRATTPAGDETKKFEKPKRSVFEQNALAKAQTLQKQRLNEGTPQVAGGRVFKGTAFVAKPDTILFKDFVLGKVYKRKILITNVSLTFNNFKILDLPETITDFFVITYTRPGRMSAGKTVMLEITFTPKINEDIIENLSFLSSTGPFTVPIRCLTQKVTPSVSTDTVRFDNIVMGESVTFPLKIYNNGAKSTFYHFTDPETGERIQPNESILARQALEKEKQPKSPKVEKKNDYQPGSPTTIAEEEIIYCANEDELIAQAEGVGAACLEYSDGLSELQYSTIGSVGSYTETTHLITFAPLSPGRFREDRILTFEGTDETIKISIIATSIKLPIYVKEPLVDMQCCIYDKLYRAKVVVKNRGKISFKAHAKVPPELKDFVSFNPDMGFIQPDVDFEIQMKFRPDPTILAKCGKYAIPGQEVIAVPMLVYVPEQALPVYYTLFAKLSTGKLSFSENVVDFRDCYITQSIMKVVKLKNESRLPQKFGFVNLRPEVEVQPNDGFGVLLPLEEKEVQVYFKPISAIYHDFDLNVITTMNMPTSIRLKCQGVDAPIKFTHTVLKFSSCCPGDKITHSVFATNTTNSKQVFEFGVPKPGQSFLRISPNVETLDPGQTCRLEIEYMPPANLLPNGDVALDAAPTEEVDGEEKKGGETPREEDAAAAPEVPKDEDELKDLQFYEGAVRKSRPNSDEPWSIHSRWSLPCFVREIPNGQAPISPRLAPPPIVTPPLFIDVHTCLVKRILDIDTPYLDFGQLAVGQVRVFPLRVRNLGDIPAPLIPSGLNSTGAFCIVNAIHDVPPNSFLQLSLQFAPLAQGVRSETLTLSCPTLGKTLTISLRGEGVSPVLLVKPEGATGNTWGGESASITTIDKWSSDVTGKGTTFCKHVLAGDLATSELTLHNSSVFPLTYNLENLSLPHENFDHKVCFDITPPESEIQPGKEVKLKVSFQPDHERIWSYKMETKISVPNQVEEHVVRLIGRCWNRQVYCVGGGDGEYEDAEERVVETMENKFELPRPLLAVQQDAEAKCGITTPERADIVLKFTRADEVSEEASEEEKRKKSSERSVIVGCIALNDAKLGSNGTFEIEIDKENTSGGYFSAVPDKGQVAPGQELSVIFKFTPPAPPGAENGGGGIEVGQWTKVMAKVKCKGGFRPSDDPEEKCYNVLLEGYIHV
jgi:hypothetical protein